MLTVFEDEDKIVRAICGGAQGYLLKTAPVAEIAAAIDDVLNGGSPMNSRIARRALSFFPAWCRPRRTTGSRRGKRRSFSSWWRGTSRRRSPRG